MAGRCSGRRSPEGTDSADGGRVVASYAKVSFSLSRLRGDRSGRHSICINDRYRICFYWRSGDAAEVEIADYH
jgi:proteic killer suppression protein